MAETQGIRDLRDTVVVITGPASGFARGAALELGRAGATLVLASPRVDQFDGLVEECRALGIRAITVPTDISRAEEVATLSASVMAEFGHLDVWINDMGDDDADQATLGSYAPESNSLLGSWYAYRHFLAQGRGTLINIASALGRRAMPHYASYIASKHCGRLVDGAAPDTADEGIHVCTLDPSPDAAAPLAGAGRVVDVLVQLVQRPWTQAMVGGDGVVKAILAH